MRQDTRNPQSRRSLLQAISRIVGGLLVFALGMAAAWLWLPEWSVGPIASRSALLDRMNRMVEGMELRSAGEPCLSLSSRMLSSNDTGDRDRRAARQAYGGKALEWLASNRRALYVLAREEVLSATGKPGILEVGFSTSARPVAVMWSPRTLIEYMARQGATPPLTAESVARLLLREREHLGGEKTSQLFLQEFHLYPVIPKNGSPRETVVAYVSASPLMSIAYRTPGDPESVGRRLGEARGAGEVAWHISRAVADLLIGLGAFVLFLALLVRKQIGFGNALALSMINLVVPLIAVATGLEGGWLSFLTILPMLFLSVGLFILWSGAESWSRATDESGMATLDRLRSGLLGPRGGRALTGGWALGAAVAGAELLISALAARFDLGWTGEATASLPAFGSGRTPLYQAAVLATIILLVRCVRSRFSSHRLFDLLALLLAAFLIAPRMNLEPFGPSMIVAAVVAAMLFRDRCAVRGCGFVDGGGGLHHSARPGAGDAAFVLASPESRGRGDLSLRSSRSWPDRRDPGRIPRARPTRRAAIPRPAGERTAGAL